MEKRNYRIIDQVGLHARPASMLVKAASSFEEEIFITYNENRLTLKSIMAVLSLGVQKDSVITIDVEGERSKEVFDALEDVLNSHNLI